MILKSFLMIQKNIAAPEAYSEQCQTSKTKLFAKIFDA